jgi:hypothetical protein
MPYAVTPARKELYAKVLDVIIRFPGFSYEQIAKASGISLSKVVTIAKESGVSRPRGRRKDVPTLLDTLFKKVS